MRTALRLAVLVAVAAILGGCASPPAMMSPSSASIDRPDSQERYESWRPDPDRRISDPQSESQLGYTGFGVHWVTPDGDARDRLDDGPGVSVTVGTFLTQHPFALAAEVAGYGSPHDSDSSIAAESENFFVTRVLAGGRLLWTGLSKDLVPYARGGWLYRWDNGDGDFEDGGGGYYLGAGLDFTVAPGLSIAPQVLFTSSELFGTDETDEFLYGLEFHINY